MSELPDHVRRNREYWDQTADRWIAPGERSWRSDDPVWGIWGVAESELGLIPSDIEGLDTIELGCGTAYVSAWLARRGARVVGIDNSEAQLATARRLQDEHELHFPLLHGNAERVPYPDGSFDLAISEYGACLWADPHAWVPEAARLLRPGGRLVFLTNSYLFSLCAKDELDTPADDRLMRSAFGMHRTEWPGDPAVEFHLSHAGWIEVLRSSSFVVESLTEVRPPPGAVTPFPYVTLDWARRWPCEEVWKAGKRA